MINNSTDLADFKARTPGAEAGVILLWKPPLVSNDALMTHVDMPAATQKMLSYLFLSYDKTHQQKELFRKASGITNIIPADNKLLETVSVFKFATDYSQIESNSNQSTEQKLAVIACANCRDEQFKKSHFRVPVSSDFGRRVIWYSHIHC